MCGEGRGRGPREGLDVGGGVEEGRWGAFLLKGVDVCLACSEGIGVLVPGSAWHVGSSAEEYVWTEL